MQLNRTELLSYQDPLSSKKEKLLGKAPGNDENYLRCSIWTGSIILKPGGLERHSVVIAMSSVWEATLFRMGHVWLQIFQELPSEMRFMTFHIRFVGPAWSSISSIDMVAHGQSLFLKVMAAQGTKSPFPETLRIIDCSLKGALAFILSFARRAIRR